MEEGVRRGEGEKERTKEEGEACDCAGGAWRERRWRRAWFYH